jgi:mono/diheme cytochrome c family protein
MNAARGLLVLAAAAVVVAILGVGMGDAPKSPDPAPTGGALIASKQRVASGSAMVQKGKEEFQHEGCDACHAIAATGAKGKLGPRLDTLAGDSVDDDVKNIIKPRADIVEGYEPHLMPTDYAKRMSAADVRAVAMFLKAASGAKQGGG